MGPLQLPLTVNLHFSPPDGRSTRSDRQDFAFPSQRLLAVLDVLFKYACARLFPPPPSGSYKRETSGSVSTPLDPEDFTSSSRPRAGGRAAPRNAWLLQRRGRLRATGRAGSIHGTDRRPRPTGQTRSVRQSPRRLHAITGAASTRAPSGSRLAQTILFAASMMWRAEMPNRSSKEAEGPLRGMDRTASL